MKTVIGWLKSNWKLIVLILALVPWGILGWVWVSELVPDNWNATYFNNVATPVATIVSAILFLAAIRQTQKQLRFAKRQHELIESEHEKGRLEQEFKIVELELKEDFSNYIKVGVGVLNGMKLEQKYSELKINAVDFIPFLRKEIADLVQDADYIQDHIEWLGEKYYPPKHYGGRSYDRSLLSIYQIGYFVDNKFGHVRRLLHKIETSKLTTEEKISFRKRIEVYWLGAYLDFIQFDGSTQVPNLDRRASKVDEPVPWIQINETALGHFAKEFGL